MYKGLYGYTDNASCEAGQHAADDDEENATDHRRRPCQRNAHALDRFFSEGGAEEAPDRLCEAVDRSGTHCA